MMHPAGLSEFALHLVEEIETAAGEIAWQKEPRLCGKMTASWRRGRPVILFVEFSDCGAVEELLHLRLDLRGFPRLRNNDYRDQTIEAATLLHNLCQHLVIFPEMRERGYRPDFHECAAAERGLLSLPKVFPNPSLMDADPSLRAMAVLRYCRAAVHCEQSRLQALLDHVADMGHYEPARRLASCVLHIVLLLGADTTRAKYEEVVLGCLRILDLKDVIGLVQARNDIECEAEEDEENTDA